MLRAAALALAAAAITLAGDDTAPPRPPANGPRRVDPGWHLLVNATVHVRPGEVRERCSVEIRDGVIVAVGGAVPAAGPRVWDAEGLHVCAAFLDPFVEVDAASPPAPGQPWNHKVTPRRSALEGPGLDIKTAEELRKLGFGAALLSPRGGIFRGRAALVSLAAPDPDASAPLPPVYRRDLFQTVSFEIHHDREGGYPDSQMGAIALIRQTLIDDDWARGKGGPAALPPSIPLLFDVADELELLRAGKIAREFGRAAVAVGAGTEYRRLEAVRREGIPCLLPLDFPQRPAVDSIGAAEAVDLREMMAWEQAPTNPRRLDAAGVKVALTTARLRNRGVFRERLRTAILHGLSEERALAMLTTHPAEILREERLGAVEAGRIANLLVCDGPPLGVETKILDLWIDGRRHELAAAPPRGLLGDWAVTLDPPVPDTVVLRIERGNKVTVLAGDAKAEGRNVLLEGGRIRFCFENAPFGEAGVVTVAGLLEAGKIVGEALRPGGERIVWTAHDRVESPAPEKKPEEPAPVVPEALGLPFGPYALPAPPPQPDAVVISGATIWTCGPQGIVHDGYLVVRRGRIDYVGTQPPPAVDGALRIDAKGRHVTPGIIDCHSHTGISKGVNESGQAVTAEVRIEDVTDPDAIGWYRELAGGVTAVNSLHGSANPIGGQNCVNKIRWGCLHPDDMHFQGAPPGIKFALGENVKQSNWGEKFTTRYPQTRMGVETLIRDRFLAAREYLAAKDRRRDLELEALGEILQGKRLIHCHSYRQDEILMLCRIAGEFGFRIGTFQHVLEGYKVADAIRAHAIGASSFTDWWAYKVEVQDAIPENGAILHEQGVCTSFNSDSDELARRMNVEAAKAVKYGDLPREEALRFVTLNPARQLGVEDRVGSLEPGKEADFAIWSGDPLSAFTRCEATWIDGREYFSLEQDRHHREWIASERRRLIQKILAAPPGEKADPAEKPKTGGPRAEARRIRFVDMLRRGIDPEAARCGQCGCEEEGR